MIKTNVDDQPIATSATITYPTPPIPIPEPIPTTMNNESDFYNWINNSPESELPSPEFGHTPLHSFEDEGIEDTPLNDLVTPQLKDHDVFTDNNGNSTLDDFEGLFTMEESPDALLSFLDYTSFGEVSGTGVESSSLLPGMNMDSEPIALMGPPTNVSFADIWDEPRKKKQKREEVQHGKVQEESTMNPADMHVSVSPPLQSVPKEQCARSMQPPNEVPIHLTSSHAGSSSSSPKSRLPLSTPDIHQTKKNQTRKYTGIRTGITPGKLIPMDAPVQSRNYILPSTTSRKELPAAFADKIAQVQVARGKKRARSEIDDNVEETIDLGGVNLNSSDASTLQKAIEAKRLQNTQAARRSRARKLEYMKNLEDKIKDLEDENDGLRNRVTELENILIHQHRINGGPT